MTPQDLAFFAVLALGLYLLLIRPQRARARAAAEIRAGLSVGSRVMTTAGIHATVLEVDGPESTVLLEVAPGVPVRFASAAVVRILEPAADTAEPAGE
ncbi:MAG: preprotein translocase subunit YajC [Mycobacteriales bacterium]